jgi:riboflavin kinase
MVKRTKTISAMRRHQFLREVTFRGKVFSGTGEGRKFIDLPWVKRQIEEKLGFTPYSGTLNIRLADEGVKQKKLLEKAERQEVCPEKGYCTGILIKARIDGLAYAAVLIPQVPTYPCDVLEVIAPWYLRERLKLTDGSEVTVTVKV